MPIFFSDFDRLHSFTLSLDNQSLPVQCPRCSQSDQFVCHDTRYKKARYGKRQVTGKRIFCSNRHGRSGCGATTMLYLHKRIPRLHYSTKHVDAFINALLSGQRTQAAYQQATGCGDPRNAYRWLAKLYKKLGAFRRLLPRRQNGQVHYAFGRTRRLRVLLPTLQRLMLLFGHSHAYQSAQAVAFL